MLFFAAATTYEQRFREGLIGPENGFLCAEEEPLRDIIEETIGRLTREARADPSSRADGDAFSQWLCKKIKAYNGVGLCDPSLHNMYPYPFS
jgi:hypothetical protein